MLWAKTTSDLVENPTATYSFPAALNLTGRTYKKEWDFTESNVTTTIASQGVALTGTPIFLTGETSTVPLPEKPPPTGPGEEAGSGPRSGTEHFPQSGIGYGYYPVHPESAYQRTSHAVFL